MRVFFKILISLAPLFACCVGQAKTIRIKNYLPLAEQMNEADATYVITGTIDLQGKALTMPANAILKFKRRSVMQNGHLVGNNTEVTGKPHISRLRLSGRYKTTTFYASWNVDTVWSDYFADVMNLGPETRIIVDVDVTLSDSKRTINHLYLVGKNKTVLNSDRFYVNHGGCTVEKLRFRWDKPAVIEPSDNYSAVIIYSSLLQKDTTVTVTLRDLDADGGRFCSYFMKQHLLGGVVKLQTTNNVDNCKFSNFTRGAVLTCGGTGIVTNCLFENLGYDSTDKLFSVIALRLGMSKETDDTGAHKYIVRNNSFSHIVSTYNNKNDGRELHGILAYGNDITISKNTFEHLSSSFSSFEDSGGDSEMIYIKGSGNTIMDNIIKDAVGASSDGAITLKVAGTNNNIVCRNVMSMSKGWGCFVFISGINHVVSDNSFINECVSDNSCRRIAVYLSHHAEDSNTESVVVKNNQFLFSSTLNYTAVFANKWYKLTLVGNTFENPSKLLAGNGMSESIIKGNIVKSGHVIADKGGNFIDLSSSCGKPAQITDNEFILKNSKYDRFVMGTQYVFNNNKVHFENTSFNSLLRGGGIYLEVQNNKLYFSSSPVVMPRQLIGEIRKPNMIVKDNYIQDAVIELTR